MKNRTESPWLDSPTITPPWSAAPGDADVVVIGAGIAGLSVALNLLEAGRGVVIVERDGVGSGETLRTSAHLSNALDDRYYDLERWHGDAGAAAAAQSHSAAIEQIAGWVQRYAIECDYALIPGYLFRDPSSAADVLEREHDAARKAGVDVELLTRTAAPLQDRRCLRFAQQARFHPTSYLDGLVRAIAQAGGRFVCADVIGVEGDDPPQVLLADAQRIAASAVVVATNVPFDRRIFPHTKQAAYRSFVIAGAVPKGSVEDALYWDTGDPYHYVRLLPRVDDDLLIVGGEDHKTGQEPDADPFAALEAWTRAFCPAYRDTEYAWSGQIIEPVDGLAFIGREPGRNNVYVVTGDSGNGLTHGTLAAPLLCALIQGREHPWAAVYDPARRKLNGTWLEENANVAAQYRDWAESGDTEAASHIARGEGAILRHGLHRFALYRDDNGALHAHSARCPHLGCAVRWNALERTFDCPCHGSRFAAADGAVINGPAARGLEPITLETVRDDEAPPQAAAEEA